jgi:hypothetical protein
MKYLLKVRGRDWYKSYIGRGEVLNKDHAQRFTKEEAEKVNRTWRNRYEIIEVKE